MTRESDAEASDCTTPIAVPAEELTRYSVERDAHSEADIANYVTGQARDETVLHVERIKREVVLGQSYEIWDVTTDKDRWWVLTNLTNLYSQRHFPSLDFTLSFHIGLMARLRERSGGVDVDDPSPFDEVFRRMDQAEERFDHAVEAEDYQSVGMQLREGLISLVGAMRRRGTIPEGNRASERLRLCWLVGFADEPFLRWRKQQGTSSTSQKHVKGNLAARQLAHSPSQCQ